MSRRTDISLEKRSFQVSCERCRRRKIKCDCTQPCSRCKKANEECHYPGTGEKRRPVTRGYVQALEGQIASLEKFIAKLVAVDGHTRDELLANFSKSSNHFQTDPTLTTTHTPDIKSADPTNDAPPIRSRTGHLKRFKNGNTAAEFYGATSLFSLDLSSEDQQDYVASKELNLLPDKAMVEFEDSRPPLNPQCSDSKSFEEEIETESTFSPRSEICKYLMGEFFRKQYHYFMYLYREGFMMHYDAGEGPYYSDMLLYAICSLGALVSDDLRELSDHFFGRAQELLYGYALETPNLTTLQALLLMGHREIGLGRNSKGWLLSGLAFRIAVEMGLHLDPNNWNESENSRVEREILRRTYWAAFVADKHFSLYLGRPPALHPNESDVINTVRIPYPPEWQPLLNRYVVQGVLAQDFEDGPVLIAFFIQQAELSNISYRIITEVFENRGVKAVNDVLAASVQDITVALRKWAADLPSGLHWNEWSVGKIPYLVLYLHMQYHTSMIILHRPPRRLFRHPAVASGEDVTTCYQSLEAIIRLLKAFSRNYKYSYLPVTFVHILASAASVILMKQHIDELAWSDPSISAPLELIMEAVVGISQTWTSALQVMDVINSAKTSTAQNTVQIESPDSFDLMAGFVEVNDQNPISFDQRIEAETFDQGFLSPDGFFDDILDWDNASFP